MNATPLIMVFLLCGLLGAVSAKAERAGDFEIAVQPINKESSQRIGGDGYWTEKEKSQTLVYKVKLTYKGLEKLENILIKYLVAYTAQGSSQQGSQGRNYGRSSVQTIKGDEKVDKLSTLDNVEFTTKMIENVYQESTWHGGKSQHGKAQMKGIALKIMQGDKVLVEWAKPAETKEYWTREDDSSRQK